MCLTACTAALLGGPKTEYTYGRATDVVVQHTGEGVCSGNSTPVGEGWGGTTAVAVRCLLFPFPWSGYFGGELAQIMRK